jgi:PAS domain S-box-containing protein
VFTDIRDFPLTNGYNRIYAASSHSVQGIFRRLLVRKNCQLPETSTSSLITGCAIKSDLSRGSDVFHDDRDFQDVNSTCSITICRVHSMTAPHSTSTRSGIADGSIELFRALFEHAPDATVVVNENGEILLVNSRTEQLFGYQRDELFSRTVELLIPERVRTAHGEHLRRYFQNPELRTLGATVDLFGRRKDGAEFPVAISLSPLQQKKGRWCASIRDVTERHNAELARRRQHQIMELILNSIDEGIIVADDNGRLTLMNRAAERLHGDASLEIPLERWSSHFSLFLPDGITPLPNRDIPMLRALAGDSVDGIELVVRSPLRPEATVINVSARPLKDAGREHGAMVLIRDVTERTLIDAALRESEDRFRNAFDHAPIGMFICSLDGAWLRVNNALCEIVGRSQVELMSVSWMEITHPDDLEPDLANVQRLLDREIPYYYMEKRYFHKDGHIVWILLHGGLVRDRRGEPLYFLGHVLDISDRKKADEELRRSADALARSNADLQQFASAASHDLQAPLRSVTGFCQLLERHYGNAFDETGKKWLQLLIQDARNMEALVRGLLRFSKVESEGRLPVSTDTSARRTLVVPFAIGNR